MPTATFQVLLFYVYKTIDNPEALAEQFRQWCDEFELKGRIIVATEGINATVEGAFENTERFVGVFQGDARFSDVSIKRSVGTGTAFNKLSVKVRKEIVATGFSREEANPEEKPSPKLSPDELRAWFRDNKEFTIVDMRNNYEFESGHFKNSIQPDIAASRELPLAMDTLEPLKSKTVVTVCTGGIRCEKMSAYLLNKGFEDVYQLEGGMHEYMQKFPGEDFLGTLYTFDNRLTMDFGGERQIIGTCKLCGEQSEKYVNCKNLACHLHFIVCEGCMEGESAYCSAACRDVDRA